MNKLWDLLVYRFSHIGEIPLCNGVPSRAPHIFGICFPLCYRCTFIFIALSLTIYLCYKYRKKLSVMMIIIGIIPIIIDGCLQTFWGIESTNLRRALTGGLFGFGMGAILAQIYLWVDQKSWM